MGWSEATSGDTVARVRRQILGFGVLSFALALASWGCASEEDGAAAPAGSTAPPTGEDGGQDSMDGSPPTDAGGGGGDGDAAPSSILDERPYAVKVPAKYDPAVPTPLVLSLHGYSGTAKVHEAYFKLGAVADEETFLLAMPDGLKDAQNNQFWAATDACCNFLNKPTDDVAYLSAVIADMKARYNVDPKRVYVVGHSNGGFMAHRLACDLSGEIAGIVSLAGALWADASKCNPTHPVAVLQVHGDADAVVAYEGGLFFPGTPSYPGAKQTVAAWAQKNGCDATLADTGEKLDLDATVAGAETKVERHACTSGAAELWTIAGGQHIPAFGPEWAARIYGFLAAHPKP
jgi:polyhydroxybutyrate depolymerase